MISEKDIFLHNVTSKITEHPEWLPDLTLALNQGLSTALSNEREKVSDLAYAFSWLLLDNKSSAIKWIDYVEKGLRRLHDFFAGARIQSTIDEILSHYKGD